jgi:hypothetical protein
LLACNEGGLIRVSGDSRSGGSAQADCTTCHTQLADEWLTVEHRKHGVSCTDCHGRSKAHVEDPIGKVPPDRPFAPNQVDGFCRGCHPRHDVKPDRVARRWQERHAGIDLDDLGESPFRCTACHGELGHAAAGVQPG